jgi:hypothetical protein
MTATTGTSEQIAHAIVDRAIAPRTLESPQTLETGSLVLLRMAAHSRSPNQQEYFAPAVVLAQYEPNGEIDALVWDASAGNAFVHGYAIRDLGTRDAAAGREQYVIQSNIGQVLFSPAAFLNLEADVTTAISRAIQVARSQQSFEAVLNEFRAKLEALEQIVTQPAATSEAAPAASLEAKQQPKADAKRT